MTTIRLGSHLLAAFIALEMLSKIPQRSIGYIHHTHDLYQFQSKRLYINSILSKSKFQFDTSYQLFCSNFQLQCNFDDTENTKYQFEHGLNPTELFLSLLESQLATIVRSTNAVYAALFINTSSKKHENENLEVFNDSGMLDDLEFICCYPRTSYESLEATKPNEQYWDAASAEREYPITYRGTVIGVLQTLYSFPNVADPDYNNSTESFESSLVDSTICESIAGSMGISLAMEMLRQSTLLEFNNAFSQIKTIESDAWLRSSSALMTSKTLLKMVGGRLNKDDEIGQEMIANILEQTDCISEALTLLSHDEDLVDDNNLVYGNDAIQSSYRDPSMITNDLNEARSPSIDILESLSNITRESIDRNTLNLIEELNTPTSKEISAVGMVVETDVVSTPMVEESMSSAFNSPQRDRESISLRKQTRSTSFFNNNRDPRLDIIDENVNDNMNDKVMIDDSNDIRSLSFWSVSKDEVELNLFENQRLIGTAPVPTTVNPETTLTSSMIVKLNSSEEPVDQEKNNTSKSTKLKKSPRQSQPVKVRNSKDKKEDDDD